MELNFDIEAVANWLALDLEEAHMAVRHFSEEALECVQRCQALTQDMKYDELDKALQGIAGTASMLQLEKINRYALKIADGAREMKPKVVDNILPLLSKEIDALRNASY